MYAIQNATNFKIEEALETRKVGSRTHVLHMYCTHVPYPRKSGPTTECRPTPHFGLNFLLSSSVYSNMRLCVAALENAAQMAGYED